MFDLGRSLLASVMRMPDAVAISDGEKILTYQAWQDDFLRTVAGLDARGLKQGDHFVTVLQNRYEAATLHMAAQIAGLVITPLNWRASAEELDYVLNDAEAKAVVFEAATADLVDTDIVSMWTVIGPACWPSRRRRRSPVPRCVINPSCFTHPAPLGAVRACPAAKAPNVRRPWRMWRRTNMPGAK